MSARLAVLLRRALSPHEGDDGPTEHVVHDALRVAAHELRIVAVHLEKGEADVTRDDVPATLTGIASRLEVVAELATNRELRAAVQGPGLRDTTTEAAG